MHRKKKKNAITFKKYLDKFEIIENKLLTLDIKT